MERHDSGGTPAALMFGGDLGDSRRIFDRAAENLQKNGFKILRRSTIYRSAPVDCVPGTPDFLDMALTGFWEGSAGELLELCQQIEISAGRPAKHSSRESRILDCDIILFGEMELESPRLVIPHPRARQRDFV